MSASNKIGDLESSQYNFSQDYWIAHSSPSTVSSSLTQAYNWF